MARGGVAVFLTPETFRKGGDAEGWLPLAKRGSCVGFNDWLYHKECVARRHPVFDGLPAPGILDWDWYGPAITHPVFEGQETPDEVRPLGGFGLGLGPYRESVDGGLLEFREF